MTIRAKILGGFIFIYIMGMILAVFGLVSTNMLTNLSDEQLSLQKAGSSISTVSNAHYKWRQDLTQAVLTGTEFTGSVDPDTCSLGTWRRGEVAQSVTDAEFLSLLSELDAPHMLIHNGAKAIIELIAARDLDGAKYKLLNEVLPETEESIALLNAMEARYVRLIEEDNIKAVDLGKLMTRIIIALLVFAAVACVLAAWRITSSIMVPIRKITRAAESISTGNLDVHIDYTVNDEVGKLAAAFHEMVSGTEKQASAAEALSNGDLTADIAPRSEKDLMNLSLKKMIENLNSMFGQISRSTTQMSSVSKQIADGAQNLAQGATEQAATVQQLSASISNVAKKTKDNAEKAGQAAALADAIRNNAEQGSAQMERMTQAVKEINDASYSINKVIKVIDDIAFQTNILALNAAVEAARAGQHGKGFAVVAEEVRSLAAKSAVAAKDTASLIANSIEKAELGAAIAGETAGSLGEIVSGIGESSQIVREIAMASGEQSAAIAEINRGIDQVAQVVQQNSATAEQSAAASAEMNGQSDILQELVSQFTLKNSPAADSPMPSLPPRTTSNGNFAYSVPADGGLGKY